MSVNGIEGLAGSNLGDVAKQRAPSQPDSPSFKEVIGDYLEETNDLQMKSGEAIRKMASGELDDLHDVMVAVEKGRVSLELVLEIRNKLLEAYRELMRMQI
jgi:flagellar hook-basal body complex protein FliE